MGVAITCTSLVVLALYVYILKPRTWFIFDSHELNVSNSIRYFPQTASNSTSPNLFAKVTPTLLTCTHWMRRRRRLARRRNFEGLGGWASGDSSIIYIPFQRAKVFEVTVTSRPRSFQLPQTIEDNPWSLSRTNPFQFDLYQNHCDKQQKNQ